MSLVHVSFYSRYPLCFAQWLGREAEEDGVLDDLFRTRGGWARLVSLRCPPQVQAGGATAVAFAAVELMESFYLRRMFTAGRFGRRALASAIREAVGARLCVCVCVCVHVGGA